ncbi:GNAT family N-acetyltransferase [Streptomyces achromogenes]|uniref:GNAT family N-acetyltransferase n=1 Tax=Streptomyces achromogenes TaxID=67255 RepID=UPI00371FB821
MGTVHGTELRPLREDEWDGWCDALYRAFGAGPASGEEREAERATTEFDRSLAAWDGDTLVGTAGAFSFRLTVPGGALVPTAGVTMVSVAATHRRRGVLTSIMRRQLDDFHERGEPVAMLTASEPAIYGRFGYGTATFRISAEIDTSRVTLALPAGTDEVRVRSAAPADVLDACEAVYAALVPRRPGMLARQPNWERVALVDIERHRDGGPPMQCVVAERDGEITGYARFHTKGSWDAGGAPAGTVRLKDLAGLDTATEAALWRFLFGIDLMTTLSVPSRPVDDALRYLVSDIRRCDPRLRDDAYVRLVDVGAALSARTYQAPVDVVFEVEDAFCPWNTGRWRLTGDAKGASCERTADAAELALSVRELGSAYLGGVSLLSLAAAGRVRELRPGALAEASVAFGSPLAPWLPHGF